MLRKVCRICKREGLKLFLKGERCFTDKCAFDRKGHAPGQHFQIRRKASDYGTQLREKQKVKRLYKVGERQFRRYIQKAETQRGITGENLLKILESRLDNVIYRMGFCSSRKEAAQLILHRHFLVNGKSVDISSYQVKVGDTIELKEGSRKIKKVTESLETVLRRVVPGWLELDKDNFIGKVLAFPEREELTLPIQEEHIIEFYSR